MKNKKGEIATFLTLGLVILGSVLVLGSSFFVKNQTASNPRAGASSGCPQYGEEVGTPSGKCSTSSTSGNWNYCQGTTYMLPIANSPFTCSGSNYYADNKTKTCYTQECCDESKASDFGYTFKGLTCGSTGSGGNGTNQGNSDNTGPTDSGSGYNAKLCPKEGLGYACCVQDNYNCSDGSAGPRYRWYGCTGQNCANTKIKNAIGHLVACPAGVGPGNIESCKPVIVGPNPGDEGGACLAGNKCNDSSLICKNNICVKKGGGGNTNVCESFNTTTNIYNYRCTHNIQVSNGILDPEKSCRVNLTPQANYKYEPNLSCGDSISVCCKQPKNQGGLPAAQCTPVSCPTGTTGGPYYKQGNYYFSNSACNKDKTTYVSSIEKLVCKTVIVNTPVPQNVNPGGTNTCIATRQALSIGNKSVNVEKVKDINNRVSCDHVLVASTNGVTIFRECPYFWQGTACVYACFDNDSEVSCGSIFDNPQYAPIMTQKQVYVTIVNNNPTKSMSLQVNFFSSSPDPIISETTVPVSGYVSGSGKCISLQTEIMIKYKREGDQEYTLDKKTIQCGFQTLIKLN